MSSLITANGDISWARPFPADRIFLTPSNGQYVVVYKDTVSGNLYYRTSADQGATWSAANAMPGSPTTTGLHSMSMINDTLHMWYVGTSIQLYTTKYNTATNQFGAQTVYPYTFTGVTSFEMMDAVYDDHGFWGVVATIVRGTKKSIGIFRTPGSDGTLATFQTLVDLNYSHSGLTQLRILAPSGQYVIFWYDGNAKKLYAAPITRTPTTYTWTPANLEQAISLTDPGAKFEVVQEANGNQTLGLAHDSALYSLTRTGANSYGYPVPLAAQIIAGQSPSMVPDGSDLYIGYATTINQPNAETYLLKRTGSRWALPIVQAGGSSNGFNYPMFGLTVSIVQDASNNITFYAWSKASAPNAPTYVTPSGKVLTTTPTVSWTSNRSAPQDPTKSVQVQVYRSSDNYLMYDSGEVVGQITSLAIPSSAGLVNNIAYKVQVREKDLLSALGAGTWGPYSAPSTFTPTAPSVDTITSVTSGGVTFSAFPATTGGADIQAVVSHTQASSDSINAYKLCLYDSDASTLLASTAFQALAPAVASGASFTTIDWTPGIMVTAHDYYLSVQTTDAVNGLTSESAKVKLTTNFTPPPTPTGFTAAPNNDAGTVVLNWANPAGTVSTLVEWNPHNEAGIAQGWQTLTPGLVNWHTLTTPNQSPQLRADYRVSVFNAQGIQSGYAIVSGVYLDNALDYAGIWLNDVTDPLNRKVYLGYVENWDSLKRDLGLEMQEWVPQGASLPFQSFGLTDYWILGTSNALKIFLPSQELDSSGGVHYGSVNRDMMISMTRQRSVLIYRDRRFPTPIFARLVAYEDQPNNDVNTDVTLELRQTGYYGYLPVVGS
ncbi:MAG: hypothetical protein LC754_10360 [Acidobacteria bacterium]|nr:hypothetical protein [Acidobacteriota bacterium]